jgi:two-component system cell cycle sensor histidine kinase/response regulator CckA
VAPRIHPHLTTLVDLNEIVAGLEPLLRRILGDDVELALVLATDLPPVESDPTQIEQTVVKLAVNAREAMPGGGKLTIQKHSPSSTSSAHTPL